MKKFDADYKLLAEMYQDDYYPEFLVDKVRALLEEVIQALEAGERDLDELQSRLDKMTQGINELAEEFDEHDSEIETMARDSIGVSVEYILQWFNIDIDVEDAIRERDW